MPKFQSGILLAFYWKISTYLAEVWVENVIMHLYKFLLQGLICKRKKKHYMDNQFDLVSELSVKVIFRYVISIQVSYDNVTYLRTSLFWGCFDYRFKAFVTYRTFFNWSIKCFCRVLYNVCCEAGYYIYTLKWKQWDGNYQVFLQ